MVYFKYETKCNGDKTTSSGYCGLPTSVRRQITWKYKPMKCWSEQEGIWDGYFDTDGLKIPIWSSTVRLTKYYVKSTYTYTRQDDDGLAGKLSNILEPKIINFGY